jgi:hypothetical protein
VAANSEIEDIYETLNTIGWDKLCERWRNQFEIVNQVVGVTGEREMYIRQGQLMILNELTALKDNVKDEMNESDSL